LHGHRGRLGVRVEPLAAGRGVRIAAVMPGGPAAQAGIKSGDILVRIDDTLISGLEDVHQALAFQQPRRKSSHRVLLQRDGTDVQLSIVIPKEP
jgi:S1-C subfamily serine protease